MEQIPQAVIDGAGTMSTQTLLWIIAGLMTVITILGNVAKSLIDRRTNPLNGALERLNSTLRDVNSTLTTVSVRAEDSNRVLTNHTEKLILMSTSVSQLAANEAAQTRALISLQPAIEASLTGCATRITEHCNARSAAIVSAIDAR